MNDKIYLLSIEEYEKYKDRIPLISNLWWLRSPGSYAKYAAIVTGGGCVYDDGYGIGGAVVCVRPALNLESANHQIGERVMFADFPWIVIDEGLAIAEVPIAWWRFDAKSNDYEKSEIRQRLAEWLESRTGN